MKFTKDIKQRDEANLQIREAETSFASYEIKIVLN